MRITKEMKSKLNDCIKVYYEIVNTHEIKCCCETNLDKFVKALYNTKALVDGHYLNVELYYKKGNFEKYIRLTLDEAKRLFKDIREKVTY